MRLSFKQKGFTLVEVLVVMVIISIVGSISLLSLGYNQNARYEKVGEQIKQMLALSSEESLLQASILGLGFSKDNFQVYRYQDQTDKTNNPWRKIADAALGMHHIPKDVQITVKVGGKVIPTMKDDMAESQPQLLIDTAGNIIPFTILIGKAGAKPHYQVQGAADGSVISGTFKG
jgi:general secretion pathway protein H